MYNAAWQNAQTVAQRPFTPYSNDPNAFVAPMNSVQLSAVNDIYGMQNAGNPYYQAAPGMAYASGNTSAAGLAPSYMSPYLDSVAAATMGILGQQQGQEQNKLSGDIAKAGQWGNSRSGVERALLSGQQNLATANTISNLYNTGYNNALGAAQTDLSRQLQAAQGLGQAGQTGAANLLQAGTVGQQTQQAGLQALYNQFLMQEQYPFQVAQFLSSTAAGLGPGYGGTTTGYQGSQQPLSYFGNPLSDPALKTGPGGKDEPEIIGETNDGQDIYRYRVVNPDTGELGPVQIGLMADEVQKRRPDAIGDYKGFKTVDYAKATDGAARMGGGVMGRGDYADGGSIADLVQAHQAMYGGLGEKPAGLVPQTQIPVAKLDAPTLHYADVPQKKSYGLGQMAEDALGLYKSGKGLYNEGKGIYDWLTTPASDSTMTSAASGMASGGIVYDATPDMTQGPENAEMPVAKLDAPQLSYGDSGSQGQSGGLGDLIKGATGLAGAAKTIFDIGSTVGPALMAFSDRRLKTGVGKADGGEVDPFDDAVKDTFRFEGGLNPSDANGTPSKYGINQKANPDVDLATLTPEKAKQLYHERYWNAIGADKLPRDIAPIAYDTAVMSGPGRAKEFLAKAGGDPNKFMDLREGYLHGLAEKNPDKYGKYVSAWDKRNASLRSGLDGGTALALAPKEERPSTPGLDAIDAHVTKGGLAPSDETYPAQGISGMVRGTPASGLGERALDFATSERFLVPLLTGLGAMASSGSRFLAPAMLQGLGAGAQAYMQVPKIQSEVMKNTLGLAATRFRPLESGNFYDTVLGKTVSPQERLSSMQGMFNGTLGGGSGGLSPATASEPAAAPVSGEAPSGAITTATDTARSVSAAAPAAAAGSDMESATILDKAMKQPQVAHYLNEAAEFERKAKNLQDMGQPDAATQFTTWANNSRTTALALAKEIARPDIAALEERKRQGVTTQNELVTVEPSPGQPKRLVKKSELLAGGGDNAPISEQPKTFEEQQSVLGKRIASLPEQYNARKLVRNNLNTLAGILEKYETGSLAEQKASASALARAVGLPVPEFDTANAPAYQEFMKNATRLVMQQAGDMGGQTLKSEIEKFSKANPNAELQPEANRAIIGQALGYLNWQDEHDKALAKWRHDNPYAYDPSAFELEWADSHPVDEYVRNATAPIVAKGSAPPPVEERIAGKTRHVNPNGHTYVWNGSGWDEEKKASH